MITKDLIVARDHPTHPRQCSACKSIIPFERLPYIMDGEGRCPVCGEIARWWVPEEQFYSSPERAAAALGSIKTARKAASSRENGKRGGATLYNRAHYRMEQMNFTDVEMDFIFADWPEGDEHYRWLLKASRDEIADWIAAGQ